MILGTAGHIDHGKTALVRALTGVDTDRLPEEKRRGITIELGFAPLHLDGVGILGVVDVPGHEAFVRTMLAGATGVDIALLVIAADEGVMPQTREHLAILTLLGVRGGVVALTKTDLVEPDWLQLVEEEVRATLEGSALAGAPITRVSARTGAGLDQLRAAVAAAAVRARSESAAAAGTNDLFRMPVDRVFTLRGTGTVVTGTVWSGTLSRGSAWIYPPGRAVRVRELHSHGQPVESVGRGTRAAVALSDVAVEEIGRGAVLVTNPDWTPSSVLRATFTPVQGNGVSIGPRTRVRFHIGSADIGARLVALGDGQVRIHLEAPAICRGGDRFVVRGGPQLTTLGGGVVLDPYSRPRARALDITDSSPAAVLQALVDEQLSDGLELSALPLRLGVPPATVAAFLRAPRLFATGQRVYAREMREAAVARLRQLVAETHARDPLAPGLDLGEARAALALPSDLFDAAVQDLAGEIAVSGAVLRRNGWVPRLTEKQAALAEKMMHAFCSTSELTVAVGSIAEAHGADALPVLRYLESEGRVIRLGDTLVAAEPVVREMVNRLQAHMAPGHGYSPAQLRDALGVSRKLLIPLLEYCDRTRITERRGSERVIRRVAG
jgi:selenocysteine-specific elongation factor